jgi:hypothetical protein
MKDQWYADNRDLVKWGVLLELCRQFHAIRILQVLCYRPSDWQEKNLKIDGKLAHSQKP